MTLFYVELKFCFSFLLKSSLLVLLYSIAIGREGGVGPLLALARSEIEVSCFPLFESFVYDLVFNFFCYIHLFYFIEVLFHLSFFLERMFMRQQQELFGTLPFILEMHST